jgi:hypothetical protein
VTQRIRRRFYSNPPWWLIILAPFTLLIVVIVAMAIRKTVEGDLPGCETCSTDRRRFVTRVWIGWAACLGLIILAAFAPTSPVLLIWLLVQIAVLIETFRGDSYRVRGKASTDGHWVELVGADEQFVRELAHALAAYQPLAGTVTGATAGMPPAPDTPPTATQAPAITATQPTATPAASPPADWYPDPSGVATHRYWDGTAWTTHTHNAPQGTV